MEHLLCASIKRDDYARIAKNAVHVLMCALCKKTIHIKISHRTLNFRVFRLVFQQSEHRKHIVTTLCSRIAKQATSCRICPHMDDMAQ